MKKPYYPNRLKDHFLSGEHFTLHPHPKFGYLQTHPQPPKDKIGVYYESEAYLSHDDDKKGIFAAAYRLAKSINLQSKKRLLYNNQPDVRSILDIGCGTGDFLDYLPNDLQKTGVEVSIKAAQIATKKGLQILGEIQEVTSQYDVISLWHVLEHLHELSPTLATIKSHLKKEGLLIIAVPNYASYDAQHYKEFWAAYDVPRHLYHFTREDIQRLADHHDLEVVKILPQYLDAYYVSLLSEKYKRSILGPLKAIYFATLSNISSLFTKQASSHIYLLRKRK